MVATDLPEIKEAGDLVHLARDEFSFEAGIQAALGEASRQLELRRVMWAAGHSWALRACQFLDAVGRK